MGFLLPRTLGSFVALLAPGLAVLIGVSAGCARGPRQEPATSISGSPFVLPEHYTHSIAALGMPGARRAFQVGHGSVVAMATRRSSGG